MSNHNTPMLFPIEPDLVWEKMRSIIHEELLKTQSNKEKPVSYEVSGLIQKPLYKAHEVCAMLQISRQTLHTWVKEGVLRQYKIKSRVFFLWNDIEKLITPNAFKK